ncbi:MAG: CdaR family protein [Anaerolineae bacterium]
MIFKTLVQQWSSLVISLFLALFVWVVATNEENPVREAVFQEPIPIQYTNRAEGLILSTRSADTVRIRVRAPDARWQSLRAESFLAIADLQGLSSGIQQVSVNVTVVDPQITVVSADPPAVSVHLELLKQITLDVHARVLDDPPVGYEVKSTTVSPTRITVSGPQSIIDQINDATVDIGLRGSKTAIDRQVAVMLHDAQGNQVQDPNLVISPSTVSVHMDVVQRVGYKEVAIKAVLHGNVSSGYWVSDIQVEPSTVTLVGTPDALDKIPGFVEAQALLVTGAQADINKQVGLALPTGVSALNVGNVTVKVSVEPVLGGITIRRSVTSAENRCELPIAVSPDTVEVILSGPLPILQSLTQDDVQIVVDVAGCAPSTVQVTPRAVNLPNSIRVESIVPNTVEVNIRSH